MKTKSRIKSLLLFLIFIIGLSLILYPEYPDIRDNFREIYVTER